MKADAGGSSSAKAQSREMNRSLDCFTGISEENWLRTRTRRRPRKREPGEAMLKKRFFYMNLLMNW